MDRKAAVRLVDRLASMDLPSEDPDLRLESADDLLLHLVACSDARGRYYAKAQMVRRSFWWADLPLETIKGWLGELQLRGDIHVDLIDGSIYGPDLVPILTIMRRSRFARFAPRLPIPDEVRQAIYSRDGYRCLHCGATEDLSLDHIYPYSLGGSDDPSNLQTLCRPCNSRKGARI